MRIYTHYTNLISQQGQKLMDSFLVGNITCRDLDEEIESLSPVHTNKKTPCHAKWEVCLLKFILYPTVYGTCKVQEDRWINSFTPYRVCVSMW